jgi:hypothetical protein
MSVGNKHPHYHKDVRGLDTIDVYRVLYLFNVTDPCIQHAVKKLLVAGGRGAGKDINKDIQEAIDSLNRWQEMRREDVAPVSDVGAAQDRLFDMLLGDDGQAWKEAERYLEKARPDLHERIQRHKDANCTVEGNRHQP